MNVANAFEFLTQKEVLLNNGDRLYIRCFEGWYVWEEKKELLGHSSTFGLCILSKPLRTIAELHSQ